MLGIVIKAAGVSNTSGTMRYHWFWTAPNGSEVQLEVSADPRLVDGDAVIKMARLAERVWKDADAAARQETISNGGPYR